MDLLGSLAGGQSQQPDETTGGDFLKCSRKGCTAEAGYRLLWNNPKIHAPERRKVWLACPEHTDYLRDFLHARGFWKATEPLEPAVIPRTSHPASSLNLHGQRAAGTVDGGS